jgi:hypothetical protein
MDVFETSAGYLIFRYRSGTVLVMAGTPRAALSNEPPEPTPLDEKRLAVSEPHSLDSNGRTEVV